MLNRRLGGACLATVFSLLIVSCTGTAPSASPSASQEKPAASAVAASPDLSAVTVEGDQTPVLKFPTPWAIEKTTVKVIKEGTSDRVVGDGPVTVNYLGVNGRTGETFDTSFGKEPATFSTKGVVPGFSKALVGQKVGSRVLVGITAEDGYPDGDGKTIAAGDNLLFVIDIVSAPATDPQGDPVALPSGVPQIEVDASGPKVKTPNEAPNPKEISLHQMIKGKREPVVAGQKVVLRARVFDWSGAVLEDSWAESESVSIPSGTGPLQSLIGQPVGSRVMVVTPPSNPSGTAGPQDQSLIFVIDVLDVMAS